MKQRGEMNSRQVREAGYQRDLDRKPNSVKLKGHYIRKIRIDRIRRNAIAVSPTLLHAKNHDAQILTPEIFVGFDFFVRVSNV
jgi:hypothetical protein